MGRARDYYAGMSLAEARKHTRDLVAYGVAHCECCPTLGDSVKKHSGGRRFRLTDDPAVLIEEMAGVTKDRPPFDASELAAYIIVHGEGGEDRLFRCPACGLDADDMLGHPSSEACERAQQESGKRSVS